jgi:hypothetical protein
MRATTPEGFLDDLCHELRLRGCHALRSAVRGWLEAAWPLVQEDPAVSRWASEYLQTWQPAEPYRA